MKLTVLKTDDGSDTVYWSQYGEAFHSGCGALSETQQLYMHASGYKDRLHNGLSERLHVLDVGLGLGYNALETVSTWYAAPAPGDLAVSSLEMSEELVRRLCACEGEWMREWTDPWLSWVRSLQQISSTQFHAKILHPTGVACNWYIIVNDASKVDDLPEGNVDYTFQDAFSPKRNPEMWTQDWFARVYRWSSPTGMIASYSCARVVKDSMSGAGWSYRRINGSIGKRHWLLATKAQQPVVMN